MKPILPHILVIDSSTSVLRIGLSISENKTISGENCDRFSHAEYIFPLIESVLAKSGISRTELNGIVVSTGPGSFTGLRVGMSSAKALSSALKIPLAGITIYSALAEPLFSEHGPTCALIPSRRDEFYLAEITSPAFDINSIRIVKISEISEICRPEQIYGVDCQLEKDDFQSQRIITSGQFSIDISDFIRPVVEQLQGGGDDIDSLEPLYIQKFQSGGKRKKQ